MKNLQNTIKIRHTANAVERLRQARQLMGMTTLLAAEMADLYNHWAKIRISDAEVKKLIAFAMAPGKEVLSSLIEGKKEDLSAQYLNIVEHVYEFAMSAPSQMERTTKGTLFGAYNAVTGYFQNVRKFQNDESKFKSIMNGTGMQRAQKAFDLCWDFATFGTISSN